MPEHTSFYTVEKPKSLVGATAELAGALTKSYQVMCGKCFTEVDSLPHRKREAAHYLRAIGWREIVPWGWLCPVDSRAVEAESAEER